MSREDQRKCWHQLYSLRWPRRPPPTPCIYASFCSFFSSPAPLCAVTAFVLRSVKTSKPPPTQIPRFLPLFLSFICCQFCLPVVLHVTTCTRTSLSFSLFIGGLHLHCKPPKVIKLILQGGSLTRWWKAAQDALYVVCCYFFLWIPQVLSSYDAIQLVDMKHNPRSSRTSWFVDHLLCSKFTCPPCRSALSFCCSSLETPGDLAISVMMCLWESCSVFISDTFSKNIHAGSHTSRTNTGVCVSWGGWLLLNLLCY